MAGEVHRGLEKDASRLKGTVTGRLAGDCLRDVKSNGWKYSKAVEQRHRELLKRAFQTARQPPLQAIRDSPIRRQVLVAGLILL